MSSAGTKPHKENLSRMPAREQEDVRVIGLNTESGAALLSSNLLCQLPLFRGLYSPISGMRQSHAKITMAGSNSAICMTIASTHRPGAHCMSIQQHG